VLTPAAKQYIDQLSDECQIALECTKNWKNVAYFFEMWHQAVLMKF